VSPLLPVPDMAQGVEWAFEIPILNCVASYSVSPFRQAE
jgi:hypothetical protein